MKKKKKMCWRKRRNHLRRFRYMDACITVTHMYFIIIVECIYLWLNHEKIRELLQRNDRVEKETERESCVYFSLCLSFISSDANNVSKPSLEYSIWRCNFCAFSPSFSKFFFCILRPDNFSFVSSFIENILHISERKKSVYFTSIGTYTASISSFWRW